MAQGVALFANPTINALTDSSVNLKDSILVNGGSTITSCGFVWSATANPDINSSHTTNNISKGAFSNTISGLTDNTTYYVRAYAVNYAGTGYSNQIIFKTPTHAPVATAASSIDSNRFTANWNAVTNV